MTKVHIKKLFPLFIGFFISTFSDIGWSYDNISKAKSLTHSGEISVNFKDEKVVIIFLSDQCPCSDSHIEHFVKLKNEFSEYKFIGIQSPLTENLDSAKTYYSKKGLNFPVLSDPHQKRVKEFGALRTPHVFVLHHGSIVFKGGVTNDANFSTANQFYLKDALTALAQGKLVADGTKKLHGCYIDRE